MARMSQKERNDLLALKRDVDAENEARLDALREGITDRPKTALSMFAEAQAAKDAEAEARKTAVRLRNERIASESAARVTTAEWLATITGPVRATLDGPVVVAMRDYDLAQAEAAEAAKRARAALVDVAVALNDAEQASPGIVRDVYRAHGISDSAQKAILG